MAKVSPPCNASERSGGLFISVLTNPTMGGVAASFASLGDVDLRRTQGADRFRGREPSRPPSASNYQKVFKTNFSSNTASSTALSGAKDLKKRNGADHRLLRQIGFRVWGSGFRIQKRGIVYRGFWGFSHVGGKHFSNRIGQVQRGLGNKGLGCLFFRHFCA